MRKLLLLIVIVLGLFLTKPFWEEAVPESVNLSFMDRISGSVVSAVNGSAIEDSWNSMLESVTSFIIDINEVVQNAPEISTENETAAIAKPDLEVPTNEIFSVHNVQLGDSESSVVEKAGQADRMSMNEFGVEWHTYHENYQNFFMASYNENGEVNGLFTNQDLISSSLPLQMGSTREEVRAELGEPLTYLQKGMVRYQLQTDGEYDMFAFNGAYITVFYDLHEEQTVTAIQIINDRLEDQRETLYAEPSAELEEGFKYQLFDLTNAARVVHGQSVLEWDEAISGTAKKHSTDMAENNFFSHDNLEGQSPFDRMDEDGIDYAIAGENLAYGQYSSVFAHEGLMNSLGHRENILKSDYAYLGIGVDFNEDSQPFFTELFFDTF
ncbi:CAP domain-containing protein [Jeotgalibacillus aurantiacus]|uniref:CAP domain-containing protein n=1 Tax=Jeotgalibacillus aurantiacus TaxID=2763266 RepID=UPI001D0BA770|nr:CAP domain-containing protein [Jeotgalibacillus aurantiacus]